MERIKYQNFQWVNLIKPERKELDQLQKEFGFHSLDITEIVSPNQRAKIEKYTNYTFLVLLFPIFDRKEKTISPSEVDFFIGPNYLITCQEGNLPPLMDMFLIAQSSEEARKKLFSDTPEMLLYNILNKLVLYCYPILDHLNLDVRDIETKIFSGKEKEMVSEILSIRRNITDTRRIMQAHKNVLLRLCLKHGREIPLHLSEKATPYFNSLIEYTKEIWDHLEALKESIEALQQTNESLISFKLRDILRILTVISVLAIPANFVAFMFGVDADNLPNLSFWSVLLISFLSSLVLFIFLRKKKWL